MTEKMIAERAVVLGASITGLLAARVLAEAYAQVVVVDRDALPTTPAARRGVPQGRHAHALLARGQQILEDLFPGLTADLIARGVPVGDVLDDVRWYTNGHRLRSARSGLLAVSASRALLECSIRTRVRALPNVSTLAQWDILGLVTTSDLRRVTGVRVIRRTDSSAGEVLDADLVVDATGRGSRTPAWLAALGYAPPAKDRVPINLGYASRTYRLRPGALGGDLAILHAPTPARRRGAVLARLEDDVSLVTLVGILGDRPPTAPDGFLAFARSLHLPDLDEALGDAEALDEPVAFRFPAGVRRRYEHLSRLPAGLVVMGDGVCSFNPVYGQGMTVAALQACALRRQLRRGTEPSPRRFQRDVARIVDVPWEMAVGADLAFPDVPGRRTVKIRASNTYVARLHAAAAHDPDLGRAFVRVTGLVDRPDALLRPHIAFRVLRPQPRGRIRGS